MSKDDQFFEKYLKYKMKYTQLKQMAGGSNLTYLRDQDKQLKTKISKIDKSIIELNKLKKNLGIEETSLKKNQLELEKETPKYKETEILVTQLEGPVKTTLEAYQKAQAAYKTAEEAYKKNDLQPIPDEINESVKSTKDEYLRAQSKLKEAKVKMAAGKTKIDRITSSIDTNRKNIASMQDKIKKIEDNNKAQLDIINSFRKSQDNNSPPFNNMNEIIIYFRNNILRLSEQIKQIEYYMTQQMMQEKMMREQFNNMQQMNNATIGVSNQTVGAMDNGSRSSVYRDMPGMSMPGMGMPMGMGMPGMGMGMPGMGMGMGMPGMMPGMGMNMGMQGSPYMNTGTNTPDMSSLLTSLK